MPPRLGSLSSARCSGRRRAVALLALAALAACGGHTPPPHPKTPGKGAQVVAGPAPPAAPRSGHRAAVAFDIATATLAKDQALLEKAEALLKRSDDLIAKGYISQNQYSDAQGDARAAAAAVVADRAAIANARLNLEFTELRSPIDGRV